MKCTQYSIAIMYILLIIWSFVSIPQSHNLSATHLLASPDGSRYLLDNSNGGKRRSNSGNSLEYRNILQTAC